MTAPSISEFDFVAETPGLAAGINPTIELETVGVAEPPSVGFPPAILDLDDEEKDAIRIHLDEKLRILIADMVAKQDIWAGQEKAYRALPQGKKTLPFVGAANEVMPVVAMVVDPTHARLDTGIFKQEPVFTIKGLKRSILPTIPGLSAWIDFYQRHFLKLRSVVSPRLLECAKLGDMVLKTVYHRDEVTGLMYDDAFNVVEQTQVRFKGPKVFGISVGDFLFPPGYQMLQDCPIVAERQRTTFDKLKAAEASKLLIDVDKIKGQERHARTALEEARETAIQHEPTRRTDDIVVYEIWFTWTIKKKPVRMVATYHLETRTFLQLRYNWYFHQRYPYTIIPFTVSNDSLHGIGLAEMVKPFQDAITRFQQMSSDNAYLANIRMYIAKRDSGIEDIPRVFAGRVFFVDDPKKDFIPFAASDIYPSTIIERQNLFGMVEKRTGTSDYSIGRESPIIGTRATATGTLALIQQAAHRVEEVLENIRVGMGEVMENCIYIWIQYGLDGLDDLVFGDDRIGEQVKEFFRLVQRENVGGAIAIDLTVTDASGSRQATQQMQLQIIQVMMSYLEKVLAAGQAALQAQEELPQFAEMIKEVMRAARQMFKDLLNKYDIRNPEDYLPDLTRFLEGETSGPELIPEGGGGLAPTPFAGRQTLASPQVPIPGGGEGNPVVAALNQAAQG